GPVHLTLALVDGQLESGGSIDASLPWRSVTEGGADSGGLASIQVRVSEGLDARLSLPSPFDAAGRIEAELAWPDRHLPRNGDWRPFLAGTDGRLRVASRFESLTWLGPLIAKVPWLDLSGAGQVNADLRIEDGSLAPGSHLDLPTVELRAEVLDTAIA